MKVIKCLRIEENIWKKLKILAVKNGNTISQQVAEFIDKEKIETKSDATIKDMF